MWLIASTAPKLTYHSKGLRRRYDALMQRHGARLVAVDAFAWRGIVACHFTQWRHLGLSHMYLGENEAIGTRKLAFAHLWPLHWVRRRVSSTGKPSTLAENNAEVSLS